MQFLEEGLYTHLKQLPAAVYGQLRGNNLPSVVYTLISDPVTTSFQLVDQIHETRYQIDVFTREYLECKQLANQLKTLLHKFSGDLGGYPVQRIFHENTTDNFEENARLHRQILTFVIFHSGPVVA